MLYVDRSVVLTTKNISLGNTSLFSAIQSASNKYDIYLINQELVEKKLPARPRISHKGSFGKAVQICGSYGMAGAAIFSAKASYDSGVGLVCCVLPDSIYPIVAQTVPEAVFYPLPHSINILPEHCESIINKINTTDSMLIGCGLSFNDQVKNAVFNILSETNIPVIIDADGINCLAERIEILEQIKVEKAVTPHYGEMSRLTGLSVEKIADDPLTVAAKFAKKYNTVTVLKGAYTVVATPDGKIFLNLLFGNSGMAVAGSGDMLAGIINSFSAQGLNLIDSAVCAVYFHALSGDLASKKYSQRGLTPSRMIESLPCLFKNFE